MSVKLSGTVAVIVCVAHPVLIAPCGWNDADELTRNGKRVEFARETSAATWLALQQGLLNAGAFTHITGRDGRK